MKELVYRPIYKDTAVSNVKDGVMFAGDLHLGHKMAAEMRGFRNVHEHDEYILGRLARQTNKRTVLWLLGDVAMELNSLYMLGRLNARMILVKGNHDLFPLKDYLHFFSDIHGIIAYKGMWISHCPIAPSEMWYKKLNVHGHTHYKNRKTNVVTPQLPLPYFNVNWDMWGRAVSLDELRATAQAHLFRPELDVSTYSRGASLPEYVDYMGHKTKVIVRPANTYDNDAKGG